MEGLLATYGWAALLASAAIMGVAGFTKGAVGFALPMIAISGIGSILPAPLAIAAIILPSLITNIWQAMRQGLAEALDSLRRFWLLNAVLLVMIALCAQLVKILPERALFLILGAGVTLFSAIQLSGWRPRDPGPDRRVATGVGLLAGFFGGLSGVWGPPIVLYLLARKVAKIEMVRVQGIAYLIGSIMLALAHTNSRLLDAQTSQFSAALILPAMLGMWIGLRVQDALPQERFRRLTMAVLVLAGLNLLRRGLSG
ncbi:MAG: sulfite exporter TauE/SafE family protein [Pseudomonadota bacterium]